MAKKIVVDYRAAWNIAKDTRGISVRLEGSNNFAKIPLSSYEEFMALLVLLQGRKTVYYDSDATAFATTRH